MKIDITDRTFKFSSNIILQANKLPRTPAGFQLGGQLIASGTSIGANVEEAQSAISKKDFIHKMNIALKEARETLYWLKLIKGTSLIPLKEEFIIENGEIIKILIAIIKNTKNNLKT